MSKSIDFWGRAPRMARNEGVPAPRLLMLVLVVTFAVCLPLLLSTAAGPVDNYRSQVYATTLLTLLATAFVCRQYSVDRRAVWGALAFAYLFHTVVSLLWAAGYPSWGATKLLQAERDRLMVWLWFCRNVTLPLAIVVGLWRDRRRPSERGSLNILAWPILAGLAAIFGFFAVSPLWSWFADWARTFDIVQDLSARPIVISLVLLLDASAALSVLRHRFRDRVSAVAVTLIALTHFFKMVSIAVASSLGPVSSAMSAMTISAWFVVGAWALAGPAALSCILLWCGVPARRS